MALVKLNWHPNAKELRTFGAIFFVGFTIIGLLKYFAPFGLISENKTLGTILIIIGAAVGGLGLTGTKIALPFYWLWLGIAYVMGNIMSRVIITLIYFLVLTPVGWLSRLVGRDKLQLKKQTTDSYWKDISLPTDPKKYERQF